MTRRSRQPQDARVARSVADARAALRWVALLGLAVVLASCFGTRRNARSGVGRGTQSEDALASLPTREQLLALRAPQPAAAPADLALGQAATPLAIARVAAVRGEMPWPLEGMDADTELAARACLWADAMGDAAATRDACGALLERAPGDARAPAAFTLLDRAVSELADGDAWLEARAQRWLDACSLTRAPCFDLAAVVGERMLDAARRADDARAVPSTADRLGRLRTGDGLGPYRGDEVVSFADAGLPVPLVEDPPYTRAFAWTSDDGALTPGARGRGGIYVLRFAGRAEGKAVLLARSSRVLRVTIDGSVVAERRRDRPEPRTTRVGLSFTRGAHVVEVTVHAAGRGDDVAIALVDERGQPALQPVASVPVRGAGVALRRLVGSAETLPLPAGEDPRDLAALDGLLWRHALARARLGLTSVDERATADALIARFGFAPEALVAAAVTRSVDDELPRRQAWTFAEPLYTRALERAPRSTRARWALTSNARAQQPERGLTLLRAHLAAAPEDDAARRALVADALEAGLLDEALAAADALVTRAATPRNLDAALPAFEAAGDLSRTAKLHALRERAGGDGDHDALARAAQRAGDTERALAEWQRAAAGAFSPSRASYIDALAPHDPARALELAEQALRATPHDDDIARRVAQLSWLVRGPDAARDAVRSLRREQPIDVALARLAEELALEPLWRARLALGDRIIAERAGAPPAFVGHPAVFLLDDVERVLFADGSSAGMRHWIVELRTKEAIDRFGEVNVDDERVLVLRVVKPDGRVVEPDIHAGVEDVSMPGLEPGDIVELLTHSFGTASPFPRAGYETRTLDLTSLPALSRSYVLDAPRALVARVGLEALAFNGLAPPLREDHEVDGEARTRFTFTLRDVPAARPEPFEPAREETARIAGFAYGVDAVLWARVRGRGLHLAARVTPWIEAAARRIAGDGDDEEKLERLFAFVARRIEPGDAADASEVLASGQGQRTPLLLAFARALGLQVTPVALHFATQPPPEVIDADAWSLVALAFTLRDRVALAVPDRLVVLDALPVAARGARMLDIDLPHVARGEARVRALPETAIAEDGVQVRVELRPGANASTASLALVGAVRIEVPAAFADGMRRDLRKAAPEVARSWLEQALQASLPGLAVRALAVPDLDAAGAPLTLDADVQLTPSPLSDGTVRFEHLFSSGAAAAFGLGAPLPAALGVDARTRPLLLAADRETLEVRLTLGADAVLLETPESLERRAGPITLAQTTEVTDGTLVWRRALSWESARVSPEEWTRLRPALAELVARLDARAAFLAAPPASL